MFREFLRDELFTAKSLATDWADCHATKCKVGERIPQDDLTTANVLDFDNLPVLDGDLVLGYVRAADVHDGILERSQIHPYRKSLILSGTLLPELACRFLSDGVEPCRLYFVVDDNESKKPIGIVTYADLNRRTAYLYTYTFILFLEQWIRKKVISKYQREHRKLDDEWMTALEGIKQRDGTPRREFLVARARKNSTSPLAECSLGDLITVLTKDKNLREECNLLSARMLQYATEFRVKVAHPTKLLLPRKNAQSVITKLFSLWRDGVEFVKANDFNEKNGRWPVES